MAGTFLFGALFGFISSSQQIYVDIYGLGVYFPVAFAAMAGLMGVSSFTNSRIVRRIGMRRLSHGAMLAFTAPGSPEGMSSVPVVVLDSLMSIVSSPPTTMNGRRIFTQRGSRRWLVRRLPVPLAVGRSASGARPPA